MNRPKAERSLPGMFPSRGPASVQPLRKQRGRDHIRRRGGYQPPEPSPYQGEMSRRDKRGRGHGEAVTDEGALLDRNPYSNGRAGEGTRPYGESRAVDVGSAEPGAVVEPQQRQFLQTQGPVARMEPQKVTRRRGGETPPVKQKLSSFSAERKISSPSTVLQ